MNEKPILFNSEMVNAILSGRKTQTRRIMKIQPQVTEQRLRELGAWQDGFNLSQQVNAAFQAGFIDVSCPLGVIGDQLWVRETFQGPLFDYEQMESYLEDSAKFESPEYCVYRADGNTAPEFVDADDNLHCKWRPSIHMPRWASRINLLITGVRVERLQDISEQDAMAEGCLYGKGNGEIDLAVRPENHFPTLWASIYGAENWQANPWVWVIEFERMEAK
ncbi:morphogenetic protein [Yersinia enterocolitica]